MAHESTTHIAVVIPSWNGRDDLPQCLDSLLAQTLPCEIIVVENGSTDGSAQLVESLYPQVTLLKQSKNHGFASGVNIGIRYALKNDYPFVALFNNDAIADKQWLKHLVETLEDNQDVGIATCKLMNIDKTHIDSTGDMYTVWGLPYPRGRGEPLSDNYDKDVYIFGASGGASLYRSDMLRQVGLFDEKFFAYYEDVDLSFRAQLAGWKVLYAPKAIAYHQISATSSRIKGFSTYQTTKNLPMLFWKNVPLRFMPVVLPRHLLAYCSIMLSAILSGRGWWAIKGSLAFLKNLPHTLHKRRQIQKAKNVPNTYIWSILVHDLPPNATKLRKLRTKWRKLTKRKPRK